MCFSVATDLEWLFHSVKLIVRPKSFSKKQGPDGQAKRRQFRLDQAIRCWEETLRTRLLPQPFRETGLWLVPEVRKV